MSSAATQPFIDDYDLYDNIYQAALDKLLEETASPEGFIASLKGSSDLLLLGTRLVNIKIGNEYLSNYQGSLIEKVICTRTPSISLTPTNSMPPFGQVKSIFCIPIQNRERVLGVIVLLGGSAYQLAMIKKYRTIFLVLRLNLENQILMSTSSAEPKSKDLFFANMSHEIRTPLNGIIGYTQLLLQTRVTDVQRQYTNSINRCSLSLAQIINDILDFSKLASGKMKVTITPTKLEEVIEFVRDTLLPKINEKKHTLSVTLPPTLPQYILTDRQKLIQILMNLLSNAVKFTNPEGTITIAVELRKPGVVAFTVKDTGIGISRENQHRLFRTFTQFDNSLSGKSYDGAGLGLAISKQLVELLHGEITLKSTLQVGSEFVFTIRYQDLSNTSWKIDAKYRGRSILLISADQEIRMVLSDILLKAGLKPTPCASLSEALKMLQSFLYDFELCLIDSSLGGDGGSIQELYPLLPTITIEKSMPMSPTSSSPTPVSPSSPMATLHGDSPRYLIQLGWGNVPILEVIEKAFRESRYIKKKDSLRVNRNLPILIAEDNQDNQDVLVKMLATLGYSNVRVVGDGVEAIRVLQEDDSVRGYKLLLLDLKMPKLDGFQVLEYLQKARKPIAVVPVTASVLEEDEERCRKYGGGDGGIKGFLRKPITLQDLQQLLLTVTAEKPTVEKSMIYRARTLSLPTLAEFP